MMTLNEKIEEALTRHDVELMRFEQGLVKDVMVDINQLKTEIVREIKMAEPQTQRELDGSLSAMDVAIDAAFAALVVQLGTALQKFSQMEQNAVAKIVDQTAKIPLLPSRFGAGTAAEIVEETRIPNTPEGTTFRERWERIKTGLKSSLRSSLGYAIDNGQSLDEKLRLVRGSRISGGRDGVVDKTKKGAETVVRTSQQSVTMATRQALFNVNPEYVSGRQAVAVLDSRTSFLCRTRNGWAWRSNGQPFRGTPIRFPGTPPWHFNCRTTLIPIFKSESDLQKLLGHRGKTELLALSRRFLIDGQPAPVPSFAKTFDAMTAVQQMEILGRGRFQLYKDKKITLKELLDQNGRELTLKELTAKYGD